MRPGMFPLPRFCPALRHSLELSTLEGKKLIDDIVALDPPIFIFTEGDPLKRSDIYELVSMPPAKACIPR